MYAHQYRAMFVENCRVDGTTKLDCPLKNRLKRSKENKGRKRRRGSTTSSNVAVAEDDHGDENGDDHDDDHEDEHPMTKATADTPSCDLFNPVFCQTCNTQVRTTLPRHVSLSVAKKKKKNMGIS